MLSRAATVTDLAKAEPTRSLEVVVLPIAPRARVRLQLDEVDLAAIFGEERIVHLHPAVACKFRPDQVTLERELGQQLVFQRDARDFFQQRLEVANALAEDLRGLEPGPSATTEPLVHLTSSASCGSHDARTAKSSSALASLWATRRNASAAPASQIKSGPTNAESPNRGGLGFLFVGHSGLEPEANGLRIHCSTN